MTGACIDRRDQLIVENAVYLFVVGLPRQANRWKCRLSIRGGFAVTSNRRKCRLSIRGELAAASKSPEMSFIYSRWVRRGKQTAETAVYLFAVSSPRQANCRNSLLSVRGEFAVTSKSPEKPFICSRWACRDKQIAGNVVYLFAVGLPRQANRRKCRLSVRGELAVTSKSPKKPFIYSRSARRDKQSTEKAGYRITGSATCQ